MNFGRLVKLRWLFSRRSVTIGRKPKLKNWLRLRVRNGSVVAGDRLSTRCGVILDAQTGHIRIGSDVSINDYSILLGHGGIEIGDNVRIAAHVVISSFEHGFDDPSMPIRLQPLTKKKIVIGDDVWIGAGAKILAGSQIAPGCVIGANSVLKGSTVPFGVYVGSPARLIKVRGKSPDETTPA